MPFTLEQLTARFGGRIEGDPAREVGGLAPLDQAGPGHLAFLANPKYLPQVETTRAAAVLITEEALAELKGRGDALAERAFVVTPNPYAYFARVAQVFVAAAAPRVSAGIHPSASVDPSARVAETATIGPFVVVEAGAVIGEHVRIDAHVFIGRGTAIGEGSRIYPNVTIYHGCALEARVIVQSGAVIGSDGFGFAPDFTGEGDARTGEWVKIPQVGGVKIGADVEIGANTTIDRGAMADTVIEHDVKIDNLVQIAHNCRIGAYTVIAGCAGIAGSTTIGRHCMIGGAVGIAGHLKIGDFVIVTAKSGVSKSLPKAGMYTSAFPAVDHAEWNRSAALLRNIDKLRDRIKALEANIQSKGAPE
ncbi:UDP-3-O-(3-hydroxymyristoyl)glucosamine N-acyltransferase [Pararobbsia silviterrae]|uniref:UDP-3-O-acylglucosamine N-acyltransferase n=1 Tax=Pararobbsia silviterrae TaxID=1792498 RepID=A0A494Y2U5_9BURK|nr:UDP-3-O-(3-hydroxymyristoyl)glucosamine N-acyltransferase [Pararobbsia silviterrae]RKP54662.1 UDP-3-O-(3-hydroxymyristoyl)glucosamine N-acyltransferase [Pararobbsia silviterrae]